MRPPVGFTEDNFGDNERVYKSFDAFYDENEAAGSLPHHDDNNNVVDALDSNNPSPPLSTPRNRNPDSQFSEQGSTTRRSFSSAITMKPNSQSSKPKTTTTTNSNKNDRNPAPFNTKKEDNVIGEPLSPLSFFSNIAEPTHIQPATTPNAPPDRTSVSSEWGYDELDDDESSYDSYSYEDYPQAWMDQEPPKDFTTTTDAPSKTQVGTHASQAGTHARGPLAPASTSSPTAVSRSDSKSQQHTPVDSSTEPLIPVNEWRAKFLQDKDLAGIAESTGRSANVVESIAKEHASRRRQPPTNMESNRQKDLVFELEVTLERLEKEIIVMNNNQTFNLASYKQVSQVLFGEPNRSTSKEVLEGMAASNVLAKLILEHRQAKQHLGRLERKATLAPNKVHSVTKAPPSARSSDQTLSVVASEPGESDPLLLVDTSSLIFRAYHSMPPMHRGTDGMPVGAVLGFCNMLNRIVLNAMLDGEKPRLVLCCDSPGPTFRHAMYDEYKAHRPEAPMDLIPQFPLIKKAAEAYGMMWIESEGFEADDVIATLATKGLEEGLHVHILSGDKDLMQLITNATTHSEIPGRIDMIDPMTMTRMTHETVIEKWGVPSHQLGDVLALAGDSADNIPGVPSIGPKIGAKLISEFGSLEDLLANTDQIPQKKRRETLEANQEQARLSKLLVALESDISWDQLQIEPALVPTEDDQPSVSSFRMQPMNPERILAFYDEMSFFTIKQRLLERLARPKDQKKKSSGAYKKTEVPESDDYKDVPF